MVVSWSNKFFVRQTVHSHSFPLRFDTQPTHFQRRIFCARNSINARPCVYLQRSEGGRHVPRWNGRKEGKGKNSQNTKEPSNVVSRGLKNIDIRMEHLCNFFASLYLLLSRNLQRSMVKRKQREINKGFVLFLFERAVCVDWY